MNERAEFELKSILDTRTHPAIESVGPLQVEWCCIRGGLSLTDHKNTCNYRLDPCCHRGFYYITCKYRISFLITPILNSISYISGLEVLKELNGFVFKHCKV